MLLILIGAIHLILIGAILFILIGGIILLGAINIGAILLICAILLIGAILLNRCYSNNITRCKVVLRAWRGEVQGRFENSFPITV